MHSNTQQHPACPAMEAMEDRLMLSTYSIMSSHYLDVGNEWQYATSTTTLGVEMVTGVTTHEITGTQSVSGKQCAVFHDVVTLTNKFGGQTTTSTSDVYYSLENNMLLLYGTSESNGSSSSVINNDPLETFPSTINSTDKNRLLGQGQFHEIDTAGNTTYDDTRVRKISYLGRENITLTVNGHSKTFSCYKLLAVNTVTRTGDPTVYKQEETGWIDPSGL